jgi:hypothetical protein
MPNRFTDQLEKTMRGGLRPIGFGRYEPADQRRLFIMAQAADNQSGAALPGVDAVYVPGACACSGEASGVLKGCNGPANEGCDFVVSDLDAAVDADPGEDTARLLTVSDDLTDAQLRALGGLEAAAVIATADLGETLSFRQLLSVQRLADFAGKPVILKLPRLYSKVELQALWHRGIAGVLVSADTVDTAELRKTVDALEPKKKGKDKTSALITQPAAATAPAEEEDDEPEIDEPEN